MNELLAVGLGGFFGAIARYRMSAWVHDRFATSFPVGTLAVNVVGCFCIGVLWTLVEERELFSASTRLVLGIGFLGSLTTFSTFGQETIALMRAGDLRFVVLSILGNVGLGLGAVMLGRGLVRLAG